MKFLKLLIVLIISLPIVSAYTPFSYYLNSPSELLQSQWAIFILMFAIFFAVTYFAVGKTINSKGAAAVLSAAIAIFIAAAISQRHSRLRGRYGTRGLPCGCGSGSKD